MEQGRDHRHPRRHPGVIPCEEMVESLTNIGIPIEEIAKFANVHPNTIKFIKIGITRSPLYATGKAIEFLYEIYVKRDADQDPL